MTEQTVNIPLLRKAVEWAEAEAAKPFELCEWYQPGFVTPAFRALDYDLETGTGLKTKAPECGTCYCVAGYVAVGVMGVELEYTSDSYDIAADALGLTETQAEELFDGGNDIEGVRRIAEWIAGEKL